jgi:colanic acid/amylovoran/stewartan biosynthesis glycosyltransferase WcaL/AmsK/CpsK
MNVPQPKVSDTRRLTPSLGSVVSGKPVALQRCDQFVGRTMNWLYDHLRHVPGYRLAVFTESLENRTEFPLLEAWQVNHWSLTRRVWRNLVGDRLPPQDWWRIRQLAPCLLHSHFGYVAVDDLRLQELLGIPWVVSFYGADLYQLGRHLEWRDRYRLVFARAAKVLALGPVMAERLQQLGCPAGKIAIHPLGVDAGTLPSRKRLLADGEPLRVLCAGTFREKKGLRYAIEAVALARRAGVSLRLCLVGDAAGKAGDDQTKETLFSEIQRLGLAEVTSHLPFVSFRDLMKVALESHVFIAPSIVAADGDAEGTPFVLQQMMATGMPVIATIHSDIPYLFGELAYLLKPERDVVAIADRLRYYAENRDALVGDGMALRDRIRDGFAAPECAARLGSLYDAVVRH